ncbi:MAG: NADPH:quinone reductase [Bacteroidetes bacterium]|nr:NADPH:quinone reductase [Rhodothermia bacterium]MCX7907312.1 NADPH:quinone reductase [Bacteroidota bacterium]MDW8137961.1 NADPH:quinone reductase [Bacteroidota bacterium]MDW8286187.1 NADPH:quinone reductase [Bacteroidota bacterium]
MQAIRVRAFGDPEVMRLEEVPTPEPAPGQVRVRIYAAGVNPVDAYIRSGVYSRLPELPYTPGHDGAGVVDAVGEGVKGLRTGDRVYVAGSITGTYAQYALCEADQVFPLPDRLSFAQGAALGIPYATAYRALFQKGRLKPGELVLVHGASGSVGLACLEWARLWGARVLGTAGTAEGMELIRSRGAEAAFNHRAPGYEDQILAWTEGRGVDLIVEMLANENLERDLGLLARGGRLIIVGSRGTIAITPRQLMNREAVLMGFMLFYTPPEERRQIHAAIQAGLQAGVLNPLVRAQWPLAEAPRAHRVVLEPGARGKIVLVPE